MALPHFTDRETEAQRVHTMNQRQAVLWGWQPGPSMEREHAAPQIWAPQLRILLALRAQDSAPDQSGGGRNGRWQPWVCRDGQSRGASQGTTGRATGSGHRDPGV